MKKFIYSLIVAFVATASFSAAAQKTECKKAAKCPKAECKKECTKK